MKVLVADDDRISRMKLARMLEKWEYHVIECENGEEAWNIIQGEDSPQLLILDWIMPVMDGLTVCRNVRNLRRDAYHYILLLTSKNDKKDIVEGMEAGADDYITKPFYPHELKVRLRAGIRIISLNRELLEIQGALQRQATHDALTGLLNRSAILKQLDQEIARRKRSGRKICIGIMDIDNFKTINDTHGHNTGDQVLRETARRLTAAMRPYDSVGRYGGEEFLIIMSECSCKRSAANYERLRTAIAATTMETDKGPIPVTASFGVSITPANLGHKPEILIGLADRALYRAKSNGKNRVELELLDTDQDS